MGRHLYYKYKTKKHFLVHFIIIEIVVMRFIALF